MLVNAANIRKLQVGFRNVYDAGLSAAKPQWNRVAMEAPSRGRANVYGWLGTVTRFREWIGDRVTQNLTAHDFEIQNIPFENSIGVDRDDIEDDEFGIYSPMLSQLGQDAAMHPDELVFGLFARGTTSKCYDGQNFFDEDHPVIGENGQAVSAANYFPGGGRAWYLLDTSKMVKPFIFQKRRDYTFTYMDALTDEAVFSRKEFRYGVDARVNAGYGLWQLAARSELDLTVDNYFAVRAAMGEFKGDNGKPLNIRPNLLVVPPSLEAKALTVLKAATIEGTDNIARGTAEPMVAPFLA
jgi:phage major head subunit gpT-like protein